MFYKYTNILIYVRHRCSQKISALVDVAYDRAAECAEPKEGEFNVLNHGDFWVNNMLFRYNDAGKVVDHIFVSI